MSSLTNTIVLLIVSYATYVVYKSWSLRLRFNRAAQIHGCKPLITVPSWDPIWGIDNQIGFLRADAEGRRSEFFRGRHTKYGETFLINFLGDKQLQTSNPENIQAICTSAFSDFGVEPMRGRIAVPFMDRGIFMVDGEFWRNARSFIKPVFTKSEISDLDNFEKHVVRFLELIPSDGTTFDVVPLARRLFMDSATEFILGQSTNCLDPEMPEETREFMEGFDRSLLGLAMFFIFGPLRWPLYWHPAWIKAYKKVHAFIDRHVSAALAKPYSAPLEAPLDSDSQDLVSRESKDKDEPEYKRYVIIEEIAKYVRDPYQLRHQAINIMFPARDTTAIGFGDVMFELARHPDEWKKLVAEVRAINPTQKLTYEFVRSLPRLKAILSESLRLHPAASRIGRISLNDAVLPKGGGPDGQSPIFVPKGTVTEMDLYTVQRDPAYWGPDADEFRPDRWSEGRPLWESKWQYEPFLGGMRMCPARNQVLTQISYLLIRFIQNFSVLENRDPVHEYVEKIAMTAESKNGAIIAVRV